MFPVGTGVVSGWGWPSGDASSVSAEVKKEASFGAEACGPFLTDGETPGSLWTVLQVESLFSNDCL